LLLDYAKTKRSERPLPLPGTLVEALTARWQQQQDERRASGRQWGGGGWADKRLVFTTRHGQPFHPGTIDRRFATLARKAGVPIRTPHALRHANATRMLEAGVSTAVVQRILGHAHEKMSRHYQHVDLAMERAAVEAVEKALRGPSERQERASGEPQ
jgi:integrase